jgi:hypothetical protein
VRHTDIISEPAALALNVIPTPVCVGKQNGELLVNATGGVGSFMYSINNGNTYQHNTTFANVAAGSYEILARDENNCIASSTSEVIVRTDRPEPDFIVSTKQNALDTLVVREISVPKPDSIEWTFGTGIDVINTNTWSPEITVKEPGTYNISLKGYFGGCDYTKHTVVTINPYDVQNPEGINVPKDVFRQISVTPNPSNGSFTVSVELNVKQRVSMKVIDLLGITHKHKVWDKTMHIEDDVNFTSDAISQGVYVVQIITDTDVREVRVLINP